MKFIPVICGPTGSGKTKLATKLKEKLDIEVLSADSRQIYIDMDIGTAKPTEDTREFLPHHLIDIVYPSNDFSAMEYIKYADNAYERVVKKGKIPVMVGGTGLYIRAFVRGLCSAPGRDPEIRKIIEEKIKKEGRDALYEELLRIDPVAGEKIPPEDTYRLIRYLEVYYLTGKPISQFWENHSKKTAHRYSAVKFFLCPPLNILKRNLEIRCKEMIRRGLLEEVEYIIKEYGESAKGLSSIGYREFVPFIRGKRNFKDCFEEFVKNSKLYAKRQITWFKKEKVVWIVDYSIEQIKETIEKYMEREIAIS